MYTDPDDLVTLRLVSNPNRKPYVFESIGSLNITDQGINIVHNVEYIQNGFFPIGKQFTLTKGQFPIQEGYDYKNNKYQLNGQPIQLHHINSMCKDENFYESHLPDEYGDITPCEISVKPIIPNRMGAGRTRKRRRKSKRQRNRSKRRKNTRRYNR